jgi:excisionase family DNA binding protein
MKKEELLDLISVADAARLREVSHQAILDLIKRGRLNVVEVGGKRFVRRTEVVGYAREKGGRPAASSVKNAAKKSSRVKTKK